MKEVYGEQTLAHGTIFHWHQQFMQGRASASPKPKSGRLVVTSAETEVNTISTMLADDDSLSQRQIAPFGISQTTVKKIILSLFFPAISIGCRRCNKLWATCYFVYFFNSYHSRLVTGLMFLKFSKLYRNLS